MRKFFVSPEDIKNNKVNIPQEEARHISTVLRLEPGEEILLYDGSGREYSARLLETGKSCTAEILEERWSQSEPAAQITLFQGVPKGEKMDWIVQKCAELGIVRIVPVLTERTVVRLEEKEGRKKQERWQKIALEACKQCGRARVPAVEAPVSFKKALDMLREHPYKLVAYEEERTGALEAFLPKAAEKLAYFIGPEGGISPAEHEALTQAGAASVTLGRRILRAETAAVAMGAILLYYLGEMNG